MQSNPNYVMREYDLALRDIIDNGFDIDGDRTGVGTVAKFGINTKYDISERVPVLTKRKVAWKSIVKEVLWYISGSSNINDLEAMGAKIWTPWKSKEFETKHGFVEGSAGYVYGFNLIHFGADVKQVESRRLAEQNPFNNVDEHMLDKIYPKSKGFNQLDYVINTLRANPKSRQACFTFWRPDTNNQAILPACHAFYSFIVSPDENGEMNVLNCHLFQRSADYPIGVGMGNIWTATLFTYMIAQQLGMKPGHVYHSGAHCHVYKNAIDATVEYLEREDEPDSPILKLNKRDSIYDYVPEDFELIDYNPLPPIKFDIAV
ncbi:Td thymidylate synthetase [Acinetobacter phage Acj61]|uniref:thymidylate synthase n=1 Tax=Acinetobacter phage Acj61 TaxID=760732 RepID=E5E4K2_9CAUD|nr:Td thymidylate synthetase [Acinetobacter phage Acj61]ADG36186.1 Td thymidylate synthetase [Acinetobacter phage Acj61]